MLRLGRPGRGEQPEPERRPEGPSDAEVIARACWTVKQAMDDPEQTRFGGVANVPLVDLCLDLRAVFVGSPAGRAVLKGMLPGQDADPVSRRIAAVQAAAAQDVAELQAELAAAKATIAALEGAADNLPCDGTYPPMYRAPACGDRSIHAAHYYPRP